MFRTWPTIRRVPWTAKLAVLGLGAYIVWPKGVTSQWIPWDDLLLITIVMNYVFGVIPEEILLEHLG